MPNTEMVWKVDGDSGKGGFGYEFDLVYKTPTDSKKTSKSKGIQSNVLATIGALLLTGIDNLQNFAAQTPVWTVSIAAGINLSYLGYRFFHNEKFMQMIQPIVRVFSSPKLSLNREKTADDLPIKILKKKHKTDDLIQDAKDPVDYFKIEKIKKQVHSKQKKRKHVIDSSVKRMLKRVYGEIYSVHYYRKVLKLSSKPDAYQREFLSYARDGWSQDNLIYDYLKPNLRSSLDARRKFSRRMLEGFVAEGILKEEELIAMFMEGLESGFFSSQKDSAMALAEYINSVDHKEQTKVLLTLQIVLRKQADEVKKTRAKAKKGNTFELNKLKSQEKEYSKIKILLISTGFKILSGFDKTDDLSEVVKSAAAVEDYFDEFADDLFREFSKYLNDVIGILNKQRNELLVQIKPQSLKETFINGITRKNSNGQGDENLRAQLKQVQTQIKRVTATSKALNQSRGRQIRKARLSIQRKAENPNKRPIILITEADIVAPAINFSRSLTNINKQQQLLIEQAI